jgi:hypothetical protein
MTPADGTARGSKADCARYVGVYFDEHRNASNPFVAQFRFESSLRHICCCPTAEAAARAYDAVAFMVPGRALNFPTTIPAAASSSRQRGAASAGQTESDILAAIAAVRQAQPPKGTVKYFGVSIEETSASNSNRAFIRQLDGKRKSLGRHPTAEAAARAYDAVACTIIGHKLNFPTGGSSAAAACRGLRTDARSLPARSTGQPSHPPRVAHDADDPPPATPASACARKRKQPSSSSLPRAGAAPQPPVRQQHLRQRTHASAVPQVHRSLQPAQQQPCSAVDPPPRPSILELFLAGIDEDGEPLNGRRRSAPPT